MPAPGVAVLVPWRPDPFRQRVWDWVRGRYRAQHPGWRVVPCIAPDGPWCKGAAVNPAVHAIREPIVVVADADVWATNLAEAVERIVDGADWVVPHTRVHRLSRQATDRLIAGKPGPLELDEPAYTGIQGGGITVLPRDTLTEVPLDERFQGWGQEDQAWGIALHYLIGPAVRLNVDLTHLWHPPQERQTRRTGSPESHALYRRYLKARSDPRLMRELLKEARCSTSC